MRHPLLQKYDRLIDFFGQVLGQDYELSLFDLRAEGCPLIFIAGGLNSGRPLGTPLAAAGLSMLERFRQGDREPLVNSHSVTADGHLLRSSAVILVDGADEPEGLLSVRFDDNRYRDLVDEMLHLCHPDHFWQEIEGLELAGLNRPSDSGQAFSAPDGELTAAEAVRRMLEERGFQNIYTTTASCTISSSLVTLALIAAALGRSRRGSTVRPKAMLSNTVIWRNSA